jgi:hypothetical protein
MTTENGPEGATPSPAPDPAAGATPAGQQERSSEGATPDTRLGESGQAALDKERGARRDAERQAAEYRRRIADLEDAGKSDVERLASQLKRIEIEADAHRKRVAELEGEISKRDLDALKAQVAAEAGLPASAAHRLQGSDARSLKRDAEALAAELQAGTPVGQIGVGRGGTASGSRVRVDMNDLIREAAGR